MGGFRARHVISGKEARLYLDGEEMAYIKNFEANVEKTKAAMKIVGRNMDSHKSFGTNGTGTATFYKVSSKMIKIMREYVKTGQDAYFTLESVLDDKGAGRGVERTVLYDVNFDSAKIAAIDVDSEGLEEEAPFTFEDFDLAESLADNFR